MKIKAIVVRILRQFIHDKRSLALMIVAPLLILTLTWLVLDQEASQPKLAVEGAPAPLEAAVQDSMLEIVDVEDPGQALADSEIDAILEADGQRIHVTVDNSEPNQSEAVKMGLQEALASRSDRQAPDISMEYLYEENAETTFDYTGPVLIGFFAFFFVFLVGGISFLRERSQGTMERLFAMPLNGWEIILGYISGFGLFAVLQSFIVALYAVYVLGIPLNGSLWLVILVTMLLSLSALTLGILLSSFARNEFQLMQFIPIVIVPQAFFSGMFSLDNAADWVAYLEYVMPISYGADALKEIMIKGNGLAEIQVDLYVVLGFSLLFYLLNLGTLKAYRK
ncbi:ABC transporter permease [Sediminibacillus dalangtanensis]|uniref:ABC transporter permease n=1 Tax=Sediminibacillus dalangtanensis TaxID=2729421 RepID=A0ABX7VML7_9BACI|nr:ABC transporter permease [Sediminibacillus dalangtanensis]QTM98062.1 ABC transporter permease [Sediminibacillus dalangtanensis]